MACKICYYEVILTARTISASGEGVQTSRLSLGTYTFPLTLLLVQKKIENKNPTGRLYHACFQNDRLQYSSTRLSVPKVFSAPAVRECYYSVTHNTLRVSYRVFNILNFFVLYVLLKELVSWKIHDIFALIVAWYQVNIP